ncbi:MAG TPA: divalent-cation tolerance protein CutA [Bryobacteraceae bacterium]|nr:divalent-cation tolerance protein CutA [Bryobacteraceae bacterium]
MTDKIVVFSSCGSAEEAGRIARRLVEAKLAACVSIVPGAVSVYRWQGRLEEAREVILMIKSSQELLGRLEAELKTAHSYEVPEILALPVLEGSRSYLDWMEASLEEDQA